MTQPAAPLAVTMGDPAGIGPEITVKAWQSLRSEDCPFFVIGCIDSLTNACSEIGMPAPKAITAAAQTHEIFEDALPVMPIDCAAVTPGNPDSKAAPAIIQSIETAVALALSGEASAVVTNPIAKSVLYDAGFRHPGHTEFLGALTADAPGPDPRGPVMMLSAAGLHVALATIHIALKDIPGAVSRNGIIKTARVMDRALRDYFGYDNPRIALTGLNPHAGEAGGIGREEIEIIINITDKIARATGPLTGITVMEVGPGPGGLTRSLLSAGAQRVVAVEMDKRFIPALDEIRTASDERLQIVLGNGLKVDPSEHGVTRIASNLPYNVGTKMLINWLTARPIFWDRLVLMFQKEVADRVTARPGDKAFGRLAILAQSVARADNLMDVPARAFTPPPKVDSAVIVLEPLPEAERYDDLKSLARVTEAVFGMRRKMLRRSLRGLAKQTGLEVEPWLDAAGVDPQKRPEALQIADFHRLADYMRENAG